MNRKQALKRLGVSFGALVAAPFTPKWSEAKPSLFSTQNSSIRHSVCRWPYESIPFEEFCQRVIPMGITSVELVGPQDWPILKKYGLDCAMPNGAESLGLTVGFNDPNAHDQLYADYSSIITKVAEAGFDKIICFSGNRNGMDDQEGMEHCVTGLKRLMPLAEKHNVTMTMELFNSKVDHPEYMADSTAWGVALVDALGSERFKLLYDIYHMQIMEGDVIRTIQAYGDYFSHYHTGGVPGRHEIDESQELYYPAIMEAIARTGYDGYVGQEFIPSSDRPLEALADGVRRCSVTA
ncbi:MAG: TIM barrel protein [Balneolaceae bacterium]|nr:TIM barrel protein [Balneolaceae bacterium]MDR9447439.1 TIM barrel protein [Balneolaceae bacterium]